MSDMKKVLIGILVMMVLASCASPRGVGNTREASKSQRYNSNRVGVQFNGIH